MANDWKSIVEEVLELQQDPDIDTAPGPAVQWYPRQLLGDDAYQLMSWPARGMHLHLINFAWTQRPPCSLPDDNLTLRGLCGYPPDWDGDAGLWAQVSRGWKHHAGRWWQIGLCKSYLAQVANRKKKKHAAEVRWAKDKKGGGVDGSGTPGRGGDAPASTKHAAKGKSSATSSTETTQEPDHHAPASDSDAPASKKGHSAPQKACPSSASSSASATASSGTSGSGSGTSSRARDPNPGRGGPPQGLAGALAPMLRTAAAAASRGWIEEVREITDQELANGSGIAPPELVLLEHYAAEGVPVEVVAAEVRRICKRQRTKSDPVTSFRYLRKPIGDAVQKWREGRGDPEEAALDPEFFSFYHRLRIAQLRKPEEHPVWRVVPGEMVARALENLEHAGTFGEVDAVLQVLVQEAEQRGGGGV